MLETTRHIVLECPAARLLLDLLLRAVAEATCPDFGALLRLRELAPRELLSSHACLLVTGFADNRGVSDPLITLVRAAQTELYSRRCFNAAVDHTAVRFGVTPSYRALRRRLLCEGLYRRREAAAWEEELSVRYPGWQDPENGPMAKWERTWVASGFLAEGATGELCCGLPETGADVPGALVAVAAVRVASGTSVMVGGRVRLSLSVGAWTEDSATEEMARLVALRGLGPGVGSDALVIYTDGAYTSGRDGHHLQAEAAGWGWVAVTGGDGGVDASAWEVACASGPVELDAEAEAYVGATRLSNNTGEGQALAEALQWLLLSDLEGEAVNAAAVGSEEPGGATAVLVRTDNELVAQWAMGLVAPSEGSSAMAAVLRRLWKAVGARRPLRWSHVKGHSDHRWNDRADALADAGCRDDVQGFSAGQPVGPAVAFDVPVVATVGRYVWRVTRAVVVASDEGSGELVVSSYFVDTTVRLVWVPPGSYLPLPDAPPDRPLDSVVRAAASLAGSQRLVCHSRPQVLVLTDTRSEEELHDEMSDLVERGVGREKEEVRVPGGLSPAQIRSRCAGPLRVLVAEDVVPVAWAEAEDEGGGVGGGWDGDGGGGLEGAHSPSSAVASPVYHAGGDGASTDDEEVPSAVQARPPTPMLARAGAPKPLLFWPARVALSPPQQPLPQPVPPPLPQQPLPQSGPSQPLSPPPGAGMEPPRVRLFAGWAVDGQELWREVWRLPAGVVRPRPWRPGPVHRSAAGLERDQFASGPHGVPRREMGKDEVKDVGDGGNGR